MVQALFLFLALQLAVFALSLAYNHIKENKPLAMALGLQNFLGRVSAAVPAAPPLSDLRAAL